AHAVTADVEGDLVQPRREPGLALEAAERAISLEAGLLAGVPRVITRTHEPEARAVLLPMPTPPQGVEGRPVPPSAPLDQFVVGGAHQPPVLKTTTRRGESYSDDLQIFRPLADA